MIIYADTRQKANKHTVKHNQMISAGITLVSKALNVGDYMSKGNPKISVDTKQNLDEVYHNIVNDTSRFMKEIRRAFFEHIKLYILVEHEKGIFSLEDICNWKSKRGSISGRELAQRMRNLELAYGIEFVFCEKQDSGKKIIELLKEKKIDTKSKEIGLPMQTDT